jgi:hypothetical protein
VGGIAELAMNAFPNARHVTFGDALGSVYDKELHLGMASGKNRKDLAMARHTPGPPKSLASSVKRALKTCVLGRPKPLQATKAVLVLPMDQTGQCLRDKKLLVVPKNIVERLLRQCERALPELSDYTASLLDSTPQPRFLLMLENFADGSFTTLEHEASLCEDIVRRHVPGGATVVLKAHPLAVAQLDKTLAARLSADYTVRCVSPAYSRYPMELWGDLVRSCQVISFSYCSISLTFLYDKAVIYPMTDALIERYIPSRFWDSYKNADALYQGQLRNLAAWDGQSVLWRGECP